MSNLDLYNKVREVPQDAQKSIGGGRLKGMTDINPMWRIKKLTEEFGACGIGWTYEILKQWTELGANGEIAAFCNINLYVKTDGDWSKPIPGTGGSMFVANEKNGAYVSDECYKMALTDALSVCCNSLGFGADVYWQKDRTKYNQQPTDPPIKSASEIKVGKDHVASMVAEIMRVGWDVGGMLDYIGKKFNCKLSVIEDVTIQQFKFIMQAMEGKPTKEAKNG